jgi:hypothetical protein
MVEIFSWSIYSYRRIKLQVVWEYKAQGNERKACGGSGDLQLPQGESLGGSESGVKAYRPVRRRRVVPIVRGSRSAMAKATAVHEASIE